MVASTRRQREELTLNLTPLIDVVFLLLIFFMVTTTFTKETRISLKLPEAEGKPQADATLPLEVTVAADGSYAVNGQPLAKNDRASLKRVLEAQAPSQIKQPLVLTADAHAAHQAVVLAMDVAGQLGFADINITTQHPQ